MFAIENFISYEVVQKIGWVLLHFVWQAAAVTFVLAFVLRILRRFSANTRYIAACIALLVVVIMPFVTMRFIKVETPPAAPVLAEAASDVMAPAITASEVTFQTLSEKPAKVVYIQPEPVITERHINFKERAVTFIEPKLSAIVTLWLVGVFALAIWHLGGYAQLQKLRKKMVKHVDSSLHDKLNVLAQKLGVTQTVQLLESALVQIPTVIGWLKPVILLPASALTGLTIEQLEAILAHELAHIKRYDYLVNILQTIVEILGFYQPAVWWISHKIRNERENCCDDLAVAICGDKIHYAKALASMEEIRSRDQFAIAATGGNLFSRICRLIGKDSNEKNALSWIPALTVILLLIALAIPTTIAFTSSRNENDSETQENKEETKDETVEGLSLSVKPVSSRFLNGDTLEFDIFYKNISDQPITICTFPDTYNVWTKLLITDTYGQIIASDQHGNGLSRKIEQSDFITLPPGITFQDRKSIESSFINGQNWPVPGKYTVTASINEINKMHEHIIGYDAICKEYNLNPWKGTATSEKTSFEIKPIPELQWGQDVNGLQLGLGFDMQNRSYYQGEPILFSVFVRNNSDKIINIKHTGMIGRNPAIFDSNDQRVPVFVPVLNIQVFRKNLPIMPGQIKPVGTLFLETKKEFNLKINQNSINPSTFLAAGTYSIQQDYRFIEDNESNWNGELITGKLTLHIRPHEENPFNKSVTQWGQAVDGVQIRLYADKTTWKKGEIPKLKLDARNNGNRELLIYRTDMFCELTVDGQPYHCIGFISIKSSPFGSGKQYNGIEITLDGRWYKNGVNEELGFSTGKHIIQVTFKLNDSRNGAIEPDPSVVIVQSNPVEIEILPEEENRTDDKPEVSQKQVLIETKILEVSEQYLKDENFLKEILKNAPIRTDMDFSETYPNQLSMSYLDDSQIESLLGENNKNIKIISKPAILAAENTNVDIWHSYAPVDMNVPFYPLSMMRKEALEALLVTIKPHVIPDNNNIILEYSFQNKFIIGVGHDGLPLFNLKEIASKASIPRGKTLIINAGEPKPDADNPDSSPKKNLLVLVKPTIISSEQTKTQNNVDNSDETDIIVASPNEFIINTSEITQSIKEKENPENLSEAKWGQDVNGLRASVEFIADKESYSLGERIGIRFKIQNVSNKDIQIAYSELLDSYAEITNSRGEDVSRPSPYNVGSGWPRITRIKLKPNETITLNNFGLGLGRQNDPALVKGIFIDPNDYTTREFNQLEPGQYSIQYKISLPNAYINSIYEEGNVPQPDDWKGTLNTQAKTINLTERQSLLSNANKGNSDNADEEDMIGPSPNEFIINTYENTKRLKEQEKSEEIPDEDNFASIKTSPANTERIDLNRISFEAQIFHSSDAFIKQLGLDANSLEKSDTWSKYIIDDTENSKSFLIDPLSADLLRKSIHGNRGSNIYAGIKFESLYEPESKAVIEIPTKERYLLSGKPSGIFKPENINVISYPLENTEPYAVISLTPEITQVNKIRLDMNLKINEFVTPYSELAINNEVVQKGRILKEKEKNTKTTNALKVFEKSLNTLISDGQSLLILGPKITESMSREGSYPLIRLPLLDQLFRTKSRSKIVGEYTILILIKPTIVSD